MNPPCCALLWPTSARTTGAIATPNWIDLHLINGQPSRRVNSDLRNLGSGAEGAGGFKPSATLWVSESIGGALKGRRIPPPFQGVTSTRTRPPGRCPGLAPYAPKLSSVEGNKIIYETAFG